MTVQKRFPIIRRAAELIGSGALLLSGKASISTSATAGSAGSLPAQPVGYLTVVANNQTYKVALYNQ